MSARVSGSGSSILANSAAASGEKGRGSFVLLLITSTRPGKPYRTRTAKRGQRLTSATINGSRLYVKQAGVRRYVRCWREALA